MTNRPIDYEHRLAKLVPNDIVTPTTEVVKEEEEVRFGRVEIVKFIETEAIGNSILETFIKEKLEKEEDIPLPPLKHVGTMIAHCTKVEKLEFVPDFDDEEPEQEHQTGWRFLGYQSRDLGTHGKFTVGKVYPDINTSDYLIDGGISRFIDDNGKRMYEYRACFEEVKDDDCQYPLCGCPETRLCMAATGKKMGE